MITLIAVYLISIAALSFVEIRLFLRHQQWKEAVVYGGLMGISAVLGSIFIAGISLPSLVVPYQIIFEPLGKMILKE